MYNKYLKLSLLYFLVIALCSVEPSYSMRRAQQIEPCEVCEKARETVRIREVDLHGENNPRPMRICEKCDRNIKFDNESKQQEATTGAMNLRLFLQQNPNLPAPQTIKTPPPAYPPGFLKK